MTEKEKIGIIIYTSGIEVDSDPKDSAPPPPVRFYRIERCLTPRSHDLLICCRAKPKCSICLLYSRYSHFALHSFRFPGGFRPNTISGKLKIPKSTEIFVYKPRDQNGVFFILKSSS